MQYRASFEINRATLSDLVSDVEAVDKLLASRRASRKASTGKDVVRFAETLLTNQ